MSLDNLNVGIVGSPPYIYTTKIKNKVIFSGLMFEIWETIAKKNNLRCNYSYLGESDFTQLIKEKSNMYDIIIGNISEGLERSEYINFTKAIKLNKINVLIKNKYNTISYLKKFLKGLVKPLAILLLLGLFLGFILHLVDPERSIVVDDAGDRFLHGIRRPILSSMASIFGEMGFVSERSNLSFKSIVVVLTIMIISYYTSIYLQAITLGDIINYNKNSVINKKNISNLNIVTTEGNELGSILKNMGVTIKTKKNIPEVVKFFKKNNNTFDGIVLDYDKLLKINSEHPDLDIDPHIFGYDTLHFCVNKNNPALLNKINNTIIYMNEQLLIRDICNKYKHVTEQTCIL